MSIKKIIIVSFLQIYSSITLGKYDYDLIVIGAGAAGITAANIAHDLGKKVALLEKNGRLGGGRLWSGDIPFKILFKVSDILYQAQHISQFGITKNGPISFNVDGVLSHVRKIQEEVYHISIPRLIECKEIDILLGIPYFIDEHKIGINDTVVSGEFILIATGSQSSIPTIEGINDITYYTRENFFELDQLPKSMIILGGGPLGTELASALNRLGVKIALIMKHGLLLPTLDYELVQNLMHIMQEEGIAIHCDMLSENIYQKDNTIFVECSDRSGTKHTFQASSIFLASGNRPNIEDLNLDAAGITCSPEGIPVRSTMQTNKDHIYACGDVVGLVLLSRIAYYHAKKAIFHMFKSQALPPYTHVSKVIFTHPPFASAGLTEQDAFKLHGNTIKLYTVDYTNIEKAHIDHATNGIAKFICDKDGYLIGVHVLGDYAAEIVDSLTIGKKFNVLYYEQLQKIRTSPSYFDIIEFAAHACHNDLCTQPNNDISWSAFIYNALASLFGPSN